MSRRHRSPQPNSGLNARRISICSTLSTFLGYNKSIPEICVNSYINYAVHFIYRYHVFLGMLYCKPVGEVFFNLILEVVLKKYS